MKKGKHYRFEDVRSYFERNGCTLLEDNYKNTKQRLKYKCSCGNKSVITFEKFKQGQRCRQCGYKKISESNSGKRKRK